MKIIDVIRLVARSTYDQVLNCVRYNLHCLDPPSVTSGMLDRYGLNSYAKKMSFWKAVEFIVSRYNGSVLFKGRFGLFKIMMNHAIEEVYRVDEEGVYVDALDCSYLKCVTTPRSHTLRIYLEGVYGERVVLRINIVTLLKIAVIENPYFRECLDEFVSEPLTSTSILKISNCALSIIIRHQSIYKLLFSRHAKDALDMIKHSPVLRRYLGV